MKYHPDEVSLSVLWRGFGHYRLDMFKSDCMAALSVAMLSVPLSMAYALAAGLPPIVGVFATIFATIFAAAFGSSRHLIVGPTNTIAILIQTGISEILYTYYRDVTGPDKAVLAVNVMIQLTFVVGLLQFFAGALKLGKLTQFVSRTVIIGYVIGAAIAIIVSQLHYLLGVSVVDRPFGVYEKVEFLATNIQNLHLPTAILGGSCLLFLLVFGKTKRFPASVIVLGMASLAVVILKYASPGLANLALVRDFGESLSDMVPSLSMPFFDLRVMSTLLPIAFAIALLGILEATTIARTIATHTGQVLSMNQEIFALGLSNTFNSFLGGMPSSGSFARSSLNYSSGAKTRLAAVLSGVFVAAIFYIFQPVVMQIPLSALAALILLAAVRMINFNELRLCVKATASDALVLVVTVLACILFNIATAFYIGVVLSIVFYLKKAAIPRFLEYGIGKEGIRILQVEGELFFAAADLLQATVKAIAQDPEVKVIVLNMQNAFHVDATACIVLHHLHSYLKRSGRAFVACGLSAGVWQVFCDSGLSKEIGSQNLFLFDEDQPHESTEKAIIWAEKVMLQKGSNGIINEGLEPSTGSHFKLSLSKGTVG